MRKSFRCCLSLLLAAVLSLSLCVPVFAEDDFNPCFHNMVLDQTNITWYEYNSSSHTWNRGSAYKCTKCGYIEKRSNTSEKAKSHSLEKKVTYNHSSPNPAKHNVVTTVKCTVCPYVQSSVTKSTGCTASGCRDYQRIDPVPVME